MSCIQIIKNDQGSYLPANDCDLPIFKHCFEGSIEVKKWLWQQNKFLLKLHNYSYQVTED